MTNQQLLPWSGSDVCTYTIAKHLVGRGHEVTVLTASLDTETILPRFEQAGVAVRVLGRNSLDGPFDIIHAHHYPMAEAARVLCPETPMVYMSHGVIPELERPPRPETKVAYYLGVSEEVVENLRLKLRGTTAAPIGLFRNPVDSDLFRPTELLPEQPNSALLLSNRATPEVRAVISGACEMAGIPLSVVGGDTLMSQDALPDMISRHSIVFSLGRGVIETMMCGRIPVVYDYLGGDGMVTPGVVKEFAMSNFSGRRYGREFTATSLAAELTKYDRHCGQRLRDVAIAMFDAGRQIERLEKIYMAVQGR